MNIHFKKNMTHKLIQVPLRRINYHMQKEHVGIPKTQNWCGGAEKQGQRWAKNWQSPGRMGREQECTRNERKNARAVANNCLRQV